MNNNKEKQELIAGLFAVYADAGRRLTQRQVQAAVSGVLGPVHIDTVRAALRRRGFDSDTREANRPKSVKRRIGEEALLRVLRDYAFEGVELRDAAARAGCSPSTLLKYGEKYGIRRGDA